jgi:hypothetical protein
MADSGLLVGALTAVTALAASYLAARGTARAALLQVRAATTAEARREERDRRRATYRELLTRVHAFMEITWRLTEADDAPDAQARDDVLERLHAEAGAAMGRLTQATREVLLDGPAPVAEAAEEVRALGMEVQRKLRLLIGTDAVHRRREYDAAYARFRDAHLAFIDLSRRALETQEIT